MVGPRGDLYKNDHGIEFNSCFEEYKQNECITHVNQRCVLYLSDPYQVFQTEYVNVGNLAG